MTKSVLILVTGLPGTGKTTLSHKLEPLLGVPLVNKDALKEILFDDIGIGDRKWSMKLGVATYNLLYYLIEQHMKSGQTLMVESPFDPKYNDDYFTALQKKHDFYCVQVLCHTNGDLLAERFWERQKTNRHPGHTLDGDDNSLEKLKRDLSV